MALDLLAVLAEPAEPEEQPLSEPWRPLAVRQAPLEPMEATAETQVVREPRAQAEQREQRAELLALRTVPKQSRPLAITVEQAVPPVQVPMELLRALRLVTFTDSIKLQSRAALEQQQAAPPKAAAEAVVPEAAEDSETTRLPALQRQSAQIQESVEMVAPETTVEQDPRVVLEPTRPMQPEAAAAEAAAQVAAEAVVQPPEELAELAVMAVTDPMASL